MYSIYTLIKLLKKRPNSQASRIFITLFLFAPIVSHYTHPSLPNLNCLYSLFLKTCTLFPLLLTISIGCVFLILFKMEFVLTLNPLFHQHKDPPSPDVWSYCTNVSRIIFSFLGGFGGHNRGDCCTSNFKILLGSVERVGDGGQWGVKKEIQSCSFTYIGYGLCNVLKIRNNTLSITQNLKIYYQFWTTHFKGTTDKEWCQR